MRTVRASDEHPAPLWNLLPSTRRIDVNCPARFRRRCSAPQPALRVLAGGHATILPHLVHRGAYAGALCDPDQVSGSPRMAPDYVPGARRGVFCGPGRRGLGAPSACNRPRRIGLFLSNDARTGRVGHCSTVGSTTSLGCLDSKCSVTGGRQRSRARAAQDTQDMLGVIFLLARVASDREVPPPVPARLVHCPGWYSRTRCFSRS